MSIAVLRGYTQAQETSAWKSPTGRHSLRCIQGGVKLISQDQVPFKICAGDSCQIYKTPQLLEMVKFPLQVLLHEHQVQWKFVDNTSVSIIETTCPLSPFCENIDCILCSAIVFDPECWPVGAITASTLIIYFLITGCYFFLYVPVVIGQPLRFATRLLWKCIRGFCFWLFQRLQRNRRTRRHSSNLVELLAVTCIIIAINRTSGFQEINLFSHASTICTQSERGQVCKVKWSEVLKIDPFKREACFKLRQNQTSIHEVRIM
ncbi:hypothetical protein RB195_006133 [Necator americanus]|uniref:Phlebovirus glycoprotein G2 fusion domain-containing protein n=1 Tax=Necator americanus TaxID=51031 RepID=A0ABR1BU08_NECAM